MSNTFSLSKNHGKVGGGWYIVTPSPRPISINNSLVNSKITDKNQGWEAGSILTRLTPAPALAQNRPALTGFRSWYQKGEGKGKNFKLFNDNVAPMDQS